MIDLGKCRRCGQRTQIVVKHGADGMVDTRDIMKNCPHCGHVSSLSREERGYIERRADELEE